MPDNQSYLPQIPPVFHVVNLFTRDLKFVTRAYIPPFNPPAEVICWGSRFFALSSNTTSQIEYIECMAFFVPPGYTDHDRSLASKGG